MPQSSPYRRLFVSDGWDEEGLRLRQRAIDERICAYDDKPLTGRQIYYCSESCGLTFWMKHWPTLDWQNVRTAALKRDDHTCVKCGDVADTVDHIQELSNGGDEFDLENCQSLCTPCHKKKTSAFLSARFKGKPRPPTGNIPSRSFK